jgi:molybdopterin converting factor small subunit
MASVTVKFNGIWRLYLGTGKISLQAGDIEQALEQIKSGYAPIFEEKLMEKGAKLEGGALKHSYVTLNRKNIKDLVDRSLKDGDTLDIFLAVPGG